MHGLEPQTIESINLLKQFVKKNHTSFGVLQGTNVFYYYKEMVGEYVMERRVDAGLVLRENGQSIPETA